MKRTIFLIVFVSLVIAGYAQGDYTLQTRGKVSVTWRLVSSYQQDCWGWTYHIFISNANNYSITLKNNSAYQNNGDNSSCWESGSVDLSNEVIPSGKFREFTFRVKTAKNVKPGIPGLTYNIDWTSDYKELKID